MESITDQIDELEDYAELMDDEAGKYLEDLIRLYKENLSCISKPLETALKEEIRRQLTFFRENYKIVDEEREVTIKEHFRELKDIRD